MATAASGFSILASGFSRTVVRAKIDAWHSHRANPELSPKR